MEPTQLDNLASRLRQQSRGNGSRLLRRLDADVRTIADMITIGAALDTILEYALVVRHVRAHPQTEQAARPLTEMERKLAERILSEAIDEIDELLASPKTMDPRQLVETMRPRIGQLCRDHHVERLDLVGIAATDKYDPQKDDVEMMVCFGSGASRAGFDSDYFKLKEALEAMLGHSIVLAERDAIRNPYRLKEFERDRVPLYAA